MGCVFDMAVFRILLSLDGNSLLCLLCGVDGFLMATAQRGYIINARLGSDSNTAIT